MSIFCARGLVLSQKLMRVLHSHNNATNIMARRSSRHQSVSKGALKVPTAPDGVRFSRHPPFHGSSGFTLSGVLCCEFATTEQMTEYLDGFSTEKEGRTALPRVGHNFEIEFMRRRVGRRCWVGSGRCGEKEFAFYEYVCHHFPETEYVIGWKRGDDLTRRHELQHARFALDAEFRRETERMWVGLSVKQRDLITEFLLRCGYPLEVHLDEFQAYFHTERDGVFGCKLLL